MRGPAGTAISLFSGCGGLDWGVEDAGFRVAAAVDVNQDAADTMEKNFHGLRSPVARRDLREIATDELLDAAGLGSGERPDLLVGGPPCIAFSKSGFWLDYKREGRDPAAGLLSAYTRVLREARPRAFLLENVYALTFRNRASRPAFQRLLQEIGNAGYDHRWGVLNAANYGVPQLRPRLFVVGVPKGQPLPKLPTPTHGGRWEGTRIGNLTQPHLTAGQALNGLVSEPEPGEVVAGQWGHLLPGIPPGDNYLHYTAKRGHPDPVFKWRSRYWNFLLKLSPDRPAPTIQAQPGPYVGPFHWENRRLRVAELKRLFSYPDDFVFVGSRKSIQAQIGNSVPPLVARRVAEALIRAL
ncbi:MAG TPA: DNA cytosine methyltransferase [Actinomycetes bacterium]|jgi:DNA (cytosine-5)-methyltransferase 1|nr:DNA cytosine methyltransferase [Actinomycetes bacterium]